MFSILADLVVLLHFCFVLFVIFGGFLVFWKPFAAWFHVPAFIWGAAIEFSGWICPLTPLENMFRAWAGEAPYGSGFVEHYVVPLLYPSALTRQMQVSLGFIVLGVNFGVYAILWQRLTKNKKA